MSASRPICALVMGASVASASFNVRVADPTRGGSGEIVCLIANPGDDSSFGCFEQPAQMAAKTNEPYENFGSGQIFCPLPREAYCIREFPLDGSVQAAIFTAECPHSQVQRIRA